MKSTIKIVIPMAGSGSRMRPLTWTKPKPLLLLAGKTVLDYSLEQFDTLPNLKDAEYIFIISPNQGDLIQKYMKEVHPEKKVHFVLQQTVRGQSDALALAREHLHGPILLAFSDTLIETNLKNLPFENAEAVAWVKPMDDPRRFGVIATGKDGWATRLVEKPPDSSNNQVVVGFYYFREAEALLAAIDEQVKRGKSLRGEYFLTDALNIYIEHGAKMRVEQVDVWLDAGIPEAVLETNRYLLDHKRGVKMPRLKAGVTILPPVSIPADAELESVVIGPYVTLGAGCKIHNSIVRNSIIDTGTRIKNKVIDGSLIGQNVVLEGAPMQMNIGDNSRLK